MSVKPTSGIVRGLKPIGRKHNILFHVSTTGNRGLKEKFQCDLHAQFYYIVILQIRSISEKNLTKNCWLKASMTFASRKKIYLYICIYVCMLLCIIIHFYI